MLVTILAAFHLASWGADRRIASPSIEIPIQIWKKVRRQITQTLQKYPLQTSPTSSELFKLPVETKNIIETTVFQYLQNMVLPENKNDGCYAMTISIFAGQEQEY